MEKCFCTGPAWLYRPNVCADLKMSAATVSPCFRQSISLKPGVVSRTVKPKEAHIGCLFFNIHQKGGGLPRQLLSGQERGVTLKQRTLFLIPLCSMFSHSFPSCCCPRQATIKKLPSQRGTSPLPFYLHITNLVQSEKRYNSGGNI
jgi:hypothetical protein